MARLITSSFSGMYKSLKTSLDKFNQEREETREKVDVLEKRVKTLDETQKIRLRGKFQLESE